MEADGLIRRTVYAGVPPKVEYDLTELGASLRPAAGLFEAWGEQYRREAHGSQEA